MGTDSSKLLCGRQHAGYLRLPQTHKSLFKDWLNRWTENPGSRIQRQAKGERTKGIRYADGPEGIGLTTTKISWTKAGVDPSTLTNINAYKEGV